MNRHIFLIGCGGHGRVVLDTLLASGLNVTGILDPALKIGDRIFGVPVLGGDEFLAQVAPTDAVVVNGLGANPHVHSRKKLFEDVKARGYTCQAIRHPSAVIASECDIGEGAQVMAGAVLQSRVQVGNNAVINTSASIDHDCMIGAHAFVSPGAVLSGEILVGAAAFIGAGAVVLPGIKIGANALIGAGAVVTKNVPEGWIVVGNPAIKIGMNE